MDFPRAKGKKPSPLTVAHFGRVFQECKVVIIRARMASLNVPAMVKIGRKINPGIIVNPVSLLAGSTLAEFHGRRIRMITDRP